MTGGYVDQYRRINRLLKICRDQYALNGHSGLPHDTDLNKQNEAMDSFYSLFLALYHLKDWIKNDPSVPKTVGRAAEKLVESSSSIGLLADTANAIKHLRIGTRSKDRIRISKDAEPSIEPILVGPLGTYPMGGFYGYSIVIETKTGDDVEALQFALNCISEWETFLKSHSLPL